MAKETMKVEVAMVPGATIAIMDAAVVGVAVAVEAVAEETNVEVVVAAIIMTRHVIIADATAIFNVHVASLEVVILTTAKTPTTPTRNSQEWTLVPFITSTPMVSNHATAHYPTGQL